MVKICGLRREEDATACENAGVTLAGINFVPGGRRAIKAPMARRIQQNLGHCKPVLVYRDYPSECIGVETEALGIRRVQLHGDESPEDCAALKEGGLWVLKALPFREDSLERELQRFAGAVSALLIDAPSPGSGRPISWEKLAQFAIPRPFFLAGGLTPDNVAEAISTVRPDGVDVASGIERDGLPCPALIARFAEEARRAFALVHPGNHTP